MDSKVYEFLDSKDWVAKTKRGTKYILLPFLRKLRANDVHAYEDISEGFIVKWLAEVQSNYAQATINKHIHVVNGLLKWLVNEGFLLTNPFPEELAVQKRPRNLIKAPTKRKVALAIDETLCIRSPLRDKALLELFYSTGIRRTELTQLNVSDIIEEEIRVLGKGNKERLVPLGEQARKALLDYVGTERKKVACRTDSKEEALFISYKYGTRLLPDSITQIFKSSELNPHSLRHACATHMLQNGASTRIIQKLLGHSSLTSTQIYTTVDTSDLKRIVLGCNPLEKLSES